MGKLKSDEQRCKHVYPVPEVLNNMIKCLKLKKRLSLKIWKKILKIRHLSANHPLTTLRHISFNGIGLPDQFDTLFNEIGGK